eukprot:TRINITY_DN12406_c0_g3_i7.p1 TRINITY_DN12406_c0_g3~~TRINITY_DN12406_c0_g3_i7.p1  ORF type:complete len:446 (+),score=90.55 TRINITY_DN12406_c0_g3_i7:81-1418(+)
MNQDDQRVTPTSEGKKIGEAETNEEEQKRSEPWKPSSDKKAAFEWESPDFQPFPGYRFEANKSSAKDFNPHSNQDYDQIRELLSESHIFPTSKSKRPGHRVHFTESKGIISARTSGQNPISHGSLSHRSFNNDHQNTTLDTSAGNLHLDKVSSQSSIKHQPPQANSREFTPQTQPQPGFGMYGPMVFQPPMQPNFFTPQMTSPLAMYQAQMPAVSRHSMQSPPHPRQNVSEHYMMDYGSGLPPPPYIMSPFSHSVNESLDHSFSMQPSNMHPMAYQPHMVGFPMQEIERRCVSVPEVFYEENDPLHFKSSPARNNMQGQLQKGKQWEFDIDVDKIEESSKTTLMIKNIPNKYDQAMLLEKIDQRFKDQYDFLYLPIDFKNNCNIGYAFINFVDTRFIRRFYEELNGKRWEKFNSEKICSIKYARIQGRDNPVSYTHLTLPTIYSV